MSDSRANQSEKVNAEQPKQPKQPTPEEFKQRRAEQIQKIQNAIVQLQVNAERLKTYEHTPNASLINTTPQVKYDEQFDSGKPGEPAVGMLKRGVDNLRKVLGEADTLTKPINDPSAGNKFGESGINLNELIGTNEKNYFSQLLNNTFNKDAWDQDLNNKKTELNNMFNAEIVTAQAAAAQAADDAKQSALKKVEDLKRQQEAMAMCMDDIQYKFLDDEMKRIADALDRQEKNSYTDALYKMSSKQPLLNMANKDELMVNGKAVAPFSIGLSEGTYHTLSNPDHACQVTKGENGDFLVKPIPVAGWSNSNMVTQARFVAAWDNVIDLIAMRKGSNEITFDFDNPPIEMMEKLINMAHDKGMLVTVSDKTFAAMMERYGIEGGGLQKVRALQSKIEELNGKTQAKIDAAEKNVKEMVQETAELKKLGDALNPANLDMLEAAVTVMTNIMTKDQGARKADFELDSSAAKNLKMEMENLINKMPPGYAEVSPNFNALQQDWQEMKTMHSSYDVAKAAILTTAQLQAAMKAQYSGENLKSEQKTHIDKMSALHNEAMPRWTNYVKQQEDKNQGLSQAGFSKFLEGQIFVEKTKGWLLGREKNYQHKVEPSDAKAIAAAIFENYRQDLTHNYVAANKIAIQPTDEMVKTIQEAHSKEWTKDLIAGELKKAYEGYVEQQRANHDPLSSEGLKEALMEARIIKTANVSLEQVEALISNLEQNHSAVWTRADDAVLEADKDEENIAELEGDEKDADFSNNNSKVDGVAIELDDAIGPDEINLNVKDKEVSVNDDKEKKLGDSSALTRLLDNKVKDFDIKQVKSALNELQKVIDDGGSPPGLEDLEKKLEAAKKLKTAFLEANEWDETATEERINKLVNKLIPDDSALTRLLNDDDVKDFDITQVEHALNQLQAVDENNPHPDLPDSASKLEAAKKLKTAFLEAGAWDSTEIERKIDDLVKELQQSPAPGK